jgi:hypothetical protein
VVYILQLNKPSRDPPSSSPPQKKNPASWLQINDGSARRDLTCMIFVVFFGLLFARLAWRRPPVARLPSDSHPVASEGAWMTSWEDRNDFAYNSFTKQARVSFGSVKEVWWTVAAPKRGGPSAEARVLDPCSSFCSSCSCGLLFLVVRSLITCRVQREERGTVAKPVPN